MWENQAPFGQCHSLGRDLALRQGDWGLKATHTVLSTLEMWLSCFKFLPWCPCKNKLRPGITSGTNSFSQKLLFVKVFYHSNRNETGTDPNVTSLQEEATHVNFRNEEQREKTKMQEKKNFCDQLQLRLTKCLFSVSECPDYHENQHNIKKWLFSDYTLTN